jgi:hypothetical protein
LGFSCKIGAIIPLIIEWFIFMVCRYFSAHELLTGAIRSAWFGTDSSTVLGKFRAAKKLWASVPVSSCELRVINGIAREVLQKDPDHADALYAVTFLAFAHGDGDCNGLLPMAKRCVSLQPQTPDVHVMLGHLYAHVGDFENSVKCFERALELEWDPEVLIQKGRILFYSKLVFEASQDLEQYIKAGEKDNSEMLWAIYGVAALWLKKGNDEKAAEYLKKGEEAERLYIKLPFNDPVGQQAFWIKDCVQELMSRKAATAGPSLVAPTSGDSPVHGNHNDDVKCGECKRSLKTSNVCGRCKKVRYCGVQCQKMHWPTHKKSCVKK